MRFLLAAQGKPDLDHAIDRAFRWPPDLFCLAAAVLKRSGAYTRLSLEPGKQPDQYPSWRWEDSPPAEVERIRRNVDDHLGSAVTVCAGNQGLLEAFHRLLVIADEACKGVGLPSHAKGLVADMADRTLEPLEYGSTLCKNIHPARARVLPKIHTPPKGLTLRSLSHYLCYVEADEGCPLWYTVPGGPLDSNRLNVLLVPWPYVITNGQFQDSRRRGVHREFDFLPADKGVEAARTICRLCEVARQQNSPVDLVILPELSLNASDYRLLKQWLLSQGISLVAGVGGTTQEGLNANRICLDIPISRTHAVHLRQQKHHPWRIDGPQIQQYKLADDLDPSRIYWENLAIGDRHLCFVALHPKLMASVLICEDLAQYEPVGRLIRSVGPNLVIAILMDGPQLSNRWSSRYTEVLTDDPGCSVLTLTSLGMSARTRDKAFSTDRSRVVALWKDSTGPSKELELDEGASALLLTLNMELIDEWTLDRRLRKAFNLRFFQCRSIVDSTTPDWFEEQKEMTPIVPVAPIEAAALARLARFVISHEENSLTKTYLQILPKLGLEARRIAYYLVQSALNGDNLGKYGAKESGREETRLREIFNSVGLSWDGPSPAEADVISTANAIRRWGQNTFSNSFPEGLY